MVSTFGRPFCLLKWKKGIDCVYREKGQPGLRPGYGKGIETRVAFLEDRIDRMHRDLQAVLARGRTEFLGEPHPHRPDAPPHPSAPHPLDAQAIDSRAQQTPRTLQSHEVLSLTSTPVVDPLPATWPGLPPQPQPQPDNGLPPDSVVRELAELFFEVIYPSFKLFYKPTFMANLTRPDREILVCGIVVISFPFWNKSTPLAESREQYVKRARERILLHNVDNCTIISTQALALLALDACGQGPGPQTWSIMAMLVAAVKQLGLAKIAGDANFEPNHPMVRNEDPDECVDQPSIEVEEKRRLFWSAYVLDRFSSFFHGSPCGIDAKRITVQFPVPDKYWGQTSTAEWFHTTAPLRPSIDGTRDLWRCQIEVLALSDRTSQLLLQPVNFSLPARCQEWQSSFRLLDTALTTWFDTLPQPVRDAPPEFNPMWIMVHATYQAVVMRMHAIAAFPPTTSPYFRPYPSSCGRCRQAIRSLQSLASGLQPHETDQLGPIFAFIVWCAARALVILWTAGYENTYGSTPPDLLSLLALLRQMSHRWQCAQHYADTIQFVLDTKNNPDGRTGLNIFNDTRHTVYGLRQRLGNLIAAHNTTHQLGPLFEFLGMPTLEDGGFPGLQPIGADEIGFGALMPSMDNEWP
ncbi:Fungal specific transcription factor domain-containing protein [Cladophialophora immunda]|nr:Fungal specific transcription factor domain-containing protein [Cladophialophora immunda]